MDLYASKSRITAGLAPLVGWLARRRVSPDAVTLAAIPVAATAAVCLLLSPGSPALLLVVPLLAALRLVLNLLDGALARGTGRSHPRGELYNEIGDRAGRHRFSWRPSRGCRAPRRSWSCRVCSGRCSRASSGSSSRQPAVDGSTGASCRNRAGWALVARGPRRVRRTARRHGRVFGPLLLSAPA